MGYTCIESSGWEEAYATAATGMPSGVNPVPRSYKGPQPVSRTDRLLGRIARAEAEYTSTLRERGFSQAQLSTVSKGCLELRDLIDNIKDAERCIDKATDQIESKLELLQAWVLKLVNEPLPWYRRAMRRIFRK